MSYELKELSQKYTEEDFEEFLFYDIEVFKNNTIIVFKDLHNNLIGCFYNGDVDLHKEDENYYKVRNFERLWDLIEGKILVGYNNYYYDDYVLSAMLEGKYQWRLHEVSTDRIAGFKSFPLNKKLFTLDCFQQINVARSGLKKVEANIGMDIEETPISFDEDKVLNAEELWDVIQYCSHDVEATIQIFKLRWSSYFVAKLQVVAMLPKDDQLMALRWNTTTIAAHLLLGNNKFDKWLKPYMASYDKCSDEEIEETKQSMYKVLPVVVRDSWEKNNIDKITVNELGCTIEFGQGGLHGVPQDQSTVYCSNVKLLDVTSLYPNIILHLDALREYTEKYKTIVDKRIAIKHKDPVLSNALKLVINSTYGLMKNKYSKIYNEKAALAVCMYGQIILYDLCEMLYDDNYKLININTDGVAFISVPGKEHLKGYEVIQSEWEDKYGFQLELSEFDDWIQKDVNNYVAKYDDSIKVKGGMVNHYHDPLDYQELTIGDYAGVTWSGTNSLGIIHKVLVEILTRYPKEQWGSVDITSMVNRYIYEDPQPILFQYILQAGRTYIGVYDQDGNEYQKVNRIFAAKKDGVTLLKHKVVTNVKGEEVISKQNFPNAPQYMYVFNKDLKEFTEFKDVIDSQYYVDLIKEKLELWK